jgi:hypothetical protein
MAFRSNPLIDELDVKLKDMSDILQVATIIVEQPNNPDYMKARDQNPLYWGLYSKTIGKGALDQMKLVFQICKDAKSQMSIPKTNFNPLQLAKKAVFKTQAELDAAQTALTRASTLVNFYGPQNKRVLESYLQQFWMTVDQWCSATFFSEKTNPKCDIPTFIPEALFDQPVNPNASVLHIEELKREFGVLDAIPQPSSSSSSASSGSASSGSSGSAGSSGGTNTSSSSNIVDMKQKYVKGPTITLYEEQGPAHPKSSALELGLAIGIPLLLLVIFLAIFFGTKGNDTSLPKPQQQQHNPQMHPPVNSLHPQMHPPPQKPTTMVKK